MDVALLIMSSPASLLHWETLSAPSALFAVTITCFLSLSWDCFSRCHLPPLPAHWLTSLHQISEGLSGLVMLPEGSGPNLSDEVLIKLIMGNNDWGWTACIFAPREFRAIVYSKELKESCFIFNPISVQQTTCLHFTRRFTCLPEFAATVWFVFFLVMWLSSGKFLHL